AKLEVRDSKCAAPERNRSAFRGALFGDVCDRVSPGPDDLRRYAVRIEKINERAQLILLKASKTGRSPRIETLLRWGQVGASSAPSRHESGAESCCEGHVRRQRPVHRQIAGKFVKGQVCVRAENGHGNASFSAERIATSRLAHAVRSCPLE